MGPQLVLMSIAVGLGLVGFVSAMFWHHRSHSPFDTVERIVRSLFVMGQCMLWGTAMAFTVLEELGFTFGGTK
jgi:hypothetical protein